MIKWILHRMTRSFERKANYDAAYMHEIIDIDPGAGMRLSALPLINQYKGKAPSALWYGAGIASMMDGDCGPCLQLMVDGALVEGVSPKDVTALLSGDLSSASEDARLGFEFGAAVVGNTPDALAIRERVILRHGKKALVGLAFVAATARAYPVIKRSMGHGASCQKVKVGPALAPVVRKAA